MVKKTTKFIKVQGARKARQAKLVIGLTLGLVLGLSLGWTLPQQVRKEPETITVIETNTIMTLDEILIDAGQDMVLDGVTVYAKP